MNCPNCNKKVFMVFGNGGCKFCKPIVKKSIGVHPRLNNKEKSKQMGEKFLIKVQSNVKLTRQEYQKAYQKLYRELQKNAGE